MANKHACVCAYTCTHECVHTYMHATYLFDISGQQACMKLGIGENISLCSNAGFIQAGCYVCRLPSSYMPFCCTGMQMCANVCVYIMHACICTYMHACMYLHIHACKCMHA